MLLGAVLLVSGPAGAQNRDNIFPPWQHGANNDAASKGLTFTVPEVDDLADFHGNPMGAKLVLYVSGNSYFTMAPLVASFEHQHPEFAGRVYYETIPPGLLLQQIKAGGTITVGNMTWTVPADAYFAGLKKIQAMIGDGILADPAIPYVTNYLTIMIPKANPAHISSLADLGRPGVRLVMPNPEFEGIARQIKSTLAKVGGTALAERVYGANVADGSTLLTHIHHRESPLFLMQSRADAGITWRSEAVFQEQIGNPIADIPIPARFNTSAIYAGAMVNGAPHPAAARLWLAFIHSPQALAIFAHYGFAPYHPKTQAAAN